MPSELYCRHCHTPLSWPDETCCDGAENERMRKALQEIRDVAACSEGVEWYVMIADRGLGNDV